MAKIIPKHTGAALNEERTHRQYLYRIWNKYKPWLAYIGLNPSTAAEEKNNPTINKIINITHWNNYGGFYIFNLFTIVSPDPKVLCATIDDFTPNVDHIKGMVQTFSMDPVFCWGNFEVYGRDKVMKKVFPDAMALGVNKNGSPKHPLYLPNKTELIKYSHL